jgi:Zn-dependent alcohol dehydrogenase
VSDHLASEIPELIERVIDGRLELSCLVSRVVPLEAAAVNGVLDGLEAFRDDVRSVVVP